MVKKRAFTLIEAVISMLIIIIIALASVPILTKAKPQVESTTLRGQYGCWYEGGTLYEWYFDERSPRTTDAVPVVADASGEFICKLKLDQRPANFYIIAAGAGGISGNPGQVTTHYTQAISNELNIRLGKTGLGNDHNTTVMNGASAEFVAAGAHQIPDSGFISSNLDKDGCAFVSDNGSDCATSCEPVTYVDTYTAAVEQKLRVNGSCLGDDEFGNPEDAIISFNDILYEGRSGGMNFENLTKDQVNSLSQANNFRYKGSYVSSGSGLGYNFEFNFDPIDSSYAHPKHMFGFEANSYTPTKSKMSQMVDTISIRRKSRLTELMSGLNAGAPNQNGAVLILW